MFQILAVHLVAFLVALLASVSHADQAGPDYRHLTDFVRNNQTAFQSVLVYEHGSAKVRLPADTVSVLLKVGQKQAHIWSDTILEGDYRAEKQVRLDRVEALFAVGNPHLVAYRITYSTRAWYTADCVPHQGLQSCEEGWIQESSFVSATIASWLRDDGAYAEFYGLTPNS